MADANSVLLLTRFVLWHLAVPIWEREQRDVSKGEISAIRVASVSHSITA